MKAPGLVNAIVAIEPGEFCFPSDDLPEDVPTSVDVLKTFMAPQPVAPEEFRKLTTFPILIIVGDNIASKPSDEFDFEAWRLTSARARQFVAAVNKRGGDATFLELPAVGLRGNTHFPMSDLNNVEVATVVEDYLARHGLDGRDVPHDGPLFEG
jgi:hypothetical protein